MILGWFNIPYFLVLGEKDGLTHDSFEDTIMPLIRD
jgi:hypothetical protein